MVTNPCRISYDNCTANANLMRIPLQSPGQIGARMIMTRMHRLTAELFAEKRGID